MPEIRDDVRLLAGVLAARTRKYMVGAAGTSCAMTVNLRASAFKFSIPNPATNSGPKRAGRRLPYAAVWVHCVRRSTAGTGLSRSTLLWELCEDNSVSREPSRLARNRLPTF